MKSRNWLATLNNPSVTAQAWLEALFEKAAAVYVCGQLERGEQGTVHVQGFVNFKNPVRLAKLKKFDPAAHWEVVKVNNGAHDYCMKEDTRVEGPYEFGTKPVQRNNK